MAAGYAGLAAAATLIDAVRAGRSNLDAAEAELDRIATSTYPYPRWLGFCAPALLSLAVTILFGGSAADALATLGVGLAIQPALERIERADLTAFFQAVFGVTATALLVVLLVKLGLPIQASLVLTGSLLLGAAIASAASLVLAVGESWGVRLQITSSGRVDWPALVLVLAGAVAVALYACRLGVPRPALLAGVALGAIAVLLIRGLTPVSAELSRPARTLAPETAPSSGCAPRSPTPGWSTCPCTPAG